MTKFFAFILVLVLGLRVLSVVLPIVAPSTKHTLRRTVVSLDIVGGLIMLLMVGAMVWLGEPWSALLLAVLGIPLFIGAYRAFPEWWWWPRQ